MVVCFEDQQIVDLVRFGASENFTIINVDTTFDLGNAIDFKMILHENIL
jgi:hypothetical protein